MSKKYRQKKQSRKDYMDNTTHDYNGKPTETKEIKDKISVKSLRYLPKSSYSIQADPYTAAQPTSNPYALLNKFNKVIGGHYDGLDNLDGGNVQQYSNSTRSKLLKVFDVIRTKLKCNYRYLPVKPQSEAEYPGYQLVDEMRKSIAEAISVLKSTTFTNMAINNYCVETDLPMGSATTKDIAPDYETEGHEPLYGYTDVTDVIYAISIYYQTTLQEIISVMNFHNSFRTKQGTMIRNAWNREVPSLNSFFGLMNKKAFLNMLESINLSFEGEYIDTEFMEQLNMITLVPSRRSNSMNDPVLEIQLQMNMPTKFRLYLKDDTGHAISRDPIFDMDNLCLSIPVDGESETVSVYTACERLKTMLSMEDTQRWARAAYVPGTVPGSDNARYNKIKYYFDVIVSSFTIFKPLMADYREALDTMTRTGTVKWRKGFRPGIIKDTDMDIYWNLLIDHIYQNLFSGSHEVSYNDATLRWTTFSLWDMYKGIPEYDVKSGGSFLTLSLKKFSDSTKTQEQYEYLPLIFEQYKNGDNGIECVALSRDGKEAIISQAAYNMNSDDVLTRLAPLASQNSLEIRVPTVNYEDNSDLTKEHFSLLIKTLTQVFGSCKVQFEEDGEYSTHIDPDVLAIYQIEIEDVTNMAITYARANAPFRGTESDQGVLGFIGLSKAKE